MSTSPESLPPGASPRAHRLARMLARPVEKFLHVEASSGILLLIAAVNALIWANSPWASTYDHLLHTCASRKIRPASPRGSQFHGSACRADSILFDRLQNVSKTGEDSRGYRRTPGDSIDGEKRRGIKVLRRKSCAINRLVDRPGSSSTPAASTTTVVLDLANPSGEGDRDRPGLRLSLGHSSPVPLLNTLAQ